MSARENRDVVWASGRIARQHRETLLGQQGCVIWFTGLSGSGKTTLAEALEWELHERGVLTYRLDGDNLRLGLNGDLDFSPGDRAENIRRIGEVAALFADAGTQVIAACISPYDADRRKAREAAGAGRFVEVFVRASLEACEARDTKGLYARARQGEIEDFTGISAPYEAPNAPEVVVDTETSSVEQGVAAVLAFLETRGTLPKAR